MLRGRSSGRPRTKKIRRQSEFLYIEDSLIVCSNCGLRGHTKRRTCTGAIKNAINVGETETEMAGTEVRETETEVDGTELRETESEVAAVVSVEDMPDMNA